MTAPVLRDYQQSAVASVEADLAVVRGAMIEAATGSGKSTVLAEIVRLHVARGERVLILAHRRELLTQLADRVALFGVGVCRGLGKRWQLAPVVVASVQSVARNLDRIGSKAFDLIVNDEAHHSVAPGWLRVLAHFPKAKLVGVTATPIRMDGCSLGVAFDRCSAKYGIEQAVAEGHLVGVRGIRVEVPGLDLSKVRRRVFNSGENNPARDGIADLHPKDLGNAVIAVEAVEGVVAPLMELAGEKRTVVFAVDVRHAMALTAALNARREGCARCVTGSSRYRDEDLREFAEGKFNFLVNVMICTEGWDCPGVEVVAMVRPTQSRTLFVQCAGRALRPYPGKTEALFLDFTSASCQFSLISIEDALAGVLVAPVRVIGKTSAPSAPVIADYVPRPWHARFRERAVDLLRRAGRAVVRAGRAAPGVGARIIRMLIGG